MSNAEEFERAEAVIAKVLGGKVIPSPHPVFDAVCDLHPGMWKVAPNVFPPPPGES